MGTFFKFFKYYSLFSFKMEYAFYEFALLFWQNTDTNTVQNFLVCFLIGRKNLSFLLTTMTKFSRTTNVPHLGKVAYSVLVPLIMTIQVQLNIVEDYTKSSTEAQKRYTVYVG